ncbi:hypothetical protein CVT24_004160 [Panaeolus cyanescens]|uniref:F-box domain-containing protein n=1 Tax=Panaeolus cyanescens TaxID=181874 RepID=A0A409Y6U9_9AGAR|nr:hypothetical protein CVT24_004160 [Panaeolus cyanescens]
MSSPLFTNFTGDIVMPPSDPDPVFPVEIFQQIIDHLASGRRRNYIPLLGTCSLVCKSFHSICQPHLLREVEVGPCFPSSREQLIGLLNRQPYLRNHIKSLTYSLWHNRIVENLQSIDGFCNNFLNLPNLKSLKIDSNKFKRLSFYSYNPDKFGFGRLVTYYTSTSLLSNLSLLNLWDVPILTILASPHLLSLELIRCSIEPPEQTLQNTSFGLRKLKAVDVEDFSSAILACCGALETVHSTGHVFSSKSSHLPI